jgi:uncharacterized protein (DUF2147 family)
MKDMHTRNESGRLPRRTGALIAWALALSGNALSADAHASPLGLWNVIDEKTGEPRALVRITEEVSGFQGRIEKLFPRPGESREPRCTQCTDSRRDQPIEGMVILSGLTKEPNALAWSGGEILDPANGKTYQCRASLDQDGRTLNVRGYLRLPVLGRTQKWLRAQ